MRLSHSAKVSVVVAGIAVFCVASIAQQATYIVKQLSPETAGAAAQAALAFCRAAGYQVTVTVVDLSGVVQVLLRDRYAGPHTVEAATRKAWTAASFRLSTSTLAIETQDGKPMSGLREIGQVMAVGGGLVIEAGGTLLAGIGVSGAPGGDADEA